MTSEDVRAELEKEPFVPLRLHLVSGKVIDVPFAGAAWLLQNAVLVFRKAKPGSVKADGYDVLAFRNIERIEQRPGKARRAKAG